MSWPKLTPASRAPQPSTDAVALAAAQARIDRALDIIRFDYKSAAVARMATSGRERAAWTAYMDTLLDLANVLEVRR